MHIQFKYDKELKGCLLQRGNDKLFFPDTDKREEVRDTLVGLIQRSKLDNTLEWDLVDDDLTLWNKLYHLAAVPPTPVETVDDLQEKLGFCNCGTPDDNIQYIRDGLRLIGSRHPDGADWDTWYAAHIKAETELHGTDGAIWFFKYWADKQGYTDHGSSVNASSLSTDGEEFLARLERAIENENV